MQIRKRIGTILMILGAVLVLAALSLFFGNRLEDRKAGESVDYLLPIIKEYIEGSDDGKAVDSVRAVGPDESSFAMTEVEIDGCDYIGYLSIPKLGLELPVMSEWDYQRLRNAPCRYTGSVKTDDLVIAAHNYSRHFGGLSQLAAGDDIYFTDLDGIRYRYQMEKTEILEPNAVKEMTSGEYDLTLFTCTYGGASRVTVRCRKTVG